MFIKSFLFAAICFYTAPVFAQDADFCAAVNVILKDAPNQFRNIKGRMIESNMNATMWASGITVPGTINTRFVASMGLFYEGAFHQTNNKAELREIYDHYKGLLSSCLVQQGYKESLFTNFNKEAAEFKKVVFMLEPKEDGQADNVAAAKFTSPPAHVALEVDYRKETGKYTVVMYIFEH